MIDQVQKDFEEWLVSVGYSTEKISKSRNGNTYLSVNLNADWQTWKAAHAKYAKSDAKIIVFNGMKEVENGRD